MTHPRLEGALAGLALLSSTHLSRYKQALAEGKQLGWGYYFPYLLTRHQRRSSSVLLAQRGDSICVFLWRAGPPPRLDLLLAPAPMDTSALRECLERANDFNGDRSARVLRIDAKDAEAVAGLPGLRVKQRRSQYLYAPEAFAEIGGRRFRTLRRNVALVEKRTDLEVLPYTPVHADGCHELLRRWGRRHREQHGTQGGTVTTALALDLTEQLGPGDLCGEVIRLDGRLVAFALGGEIRPGVGCFFDAKSEPDVPGLSYFQRYSFLSKLDDCGLVNDGSDVGRAGLRQLKDSLRPAQMHAEFRGSQVD